MSLSFPGHGSNQDYSIRSRAQRKGLDIGPSQSASASQFSSGGTKSYGSQAHMIVAKCTTVFHVWSTYVVVEYLELSKHLAIAS